MHHIFQTSRAFFELLVVFLKIIHPQQIQKIFSVINTGMLIVWLKTALKYQALTITNAYKTKQNFFFF